MISCARTPLLLLGLLVLTVPQASAAGECPRFAPAHEGLPTTLEWRTHPTLADVNGDGHLDLAAIPRKGHAPGVWLGDGKGHWKPASLGLLIPGFTCGVGTDLVDVNGDGHLDLGVADHCQGAHLFLGDGKGRWAMSPGLADMTGNVGLDDLQFGDLDGDGFVDMVGIAGIRGGFRALRGTSEGRLRRADFGLPDSGYGPDLKIVDLNADGRPDIIAAFTAEASGLHPHARTVQAAWLNGEDGFHDASTGLPEQGNLRGVAAGDVDGDGNVDLAISGGSWPDREPLAIYRGNGGKAWQAFETQPSKPGDPVFEGIELVDLDGDDKLDLIGVTHQDAGLAVWMGDGKGAFKACEDTGLPNGRDTLRGWGIDVGDVNGDGRADIALGIGRATEGSLEVWIQR